MKVVEVRRASSDYVLQSVCLYDLKVIVAVVVIHQLDIRTYMFAVIKIQQPLAIEVSQGAWFEL